jgi:hypothetical protein
MRMRARGACERVQQGCTAVTVSDAQQMHSRCIAGQIIYGRRHTVNKKGSSKASCRSQYRGASCKTTRSCGSPWKRATPAFLTPSSSALTTRSIHRNRGNRWGGRGATAFINSVIIQQYPSETSQTGMSTARRRSPVRCCRRRATGDRVVRLTASITAVANNEHNKTYSNSIVSGYLAASVCPQSGRHRFAGHTRSWHAAASGTPTSLFAALETQRMMPSSLRHISGIYVSRIKLFPSK